MKKLIRDFCEDSQNTENMLIFDLPTGTGKTSAVIDYMTDRIKRDVPGLMVFTTTYKNNLPVDQLRAAFEAAGIGDLFDEKVLVCQKIIDDFCDGLMELDYSDLYNIEKFLGECEETSNLRKMKDALGPDGRNREYLNKGLYKDTFSTFENKFRKLLKNKLKDTYRNPSERRKAVTSDSERTGLYWVRLLYPSVRTWDCSILMMTVHKFINRYDTIVEGNSRFCDSEFLDGSTVFMDEFDAAWNTILRIICENDFRMPDQIRMFRNILNGLEHRDTRPVSMYAVTDSYSKKHQSNGLRNYADDLHAKAVELNEKYHLYYDFKFSGDQGQKFIFHDRVTLTIGKEERFGISFDERKKINIISNESNAAESYLNPLFGDLYSFFRYFAAYVRDTAQNFLEVGRLEGNMISYESALWSVLNEFDFDLDQKEYFIDSILECRYKNRIEPDLNDLSVYNLGFRYHVFQDNDYHKFYTRIGMRSVTSSPESILLNVLGHEGLKFIGISATANIETVTGNFNFHYMENYPEIYRPHTLTSDEDERLNDFVTSRLGNYDGKVTIDVKLVDPDSPELIFNDGMMQYKLRTMINPFEGFEKERFVRLLKSYRDFLESPARSMIAFMNLKVSDTGLLSNENLTEMLNCIRSEHGYEEIDRPYESLYADNFNKTKKAILDRLSKGEKIFVLTTYASVGAGQNLQYRIPDDVLVRFVGSDKRFDDRMKDFDAIYLDEPTGIIPDVSKGDSAKLAEAILMTEFLYYSAEITSYEKRELIRSAFNGFMGIGYTRPAVKDRDSFKAAYARRIIQALGRICRTHNKSSTVYIMADINLANVFIGDIERYGKRFNQEFKVLFEELIGLGRDITPTGVKLDSHADRMCSSHIERLCYSDGPWSEDKMRAWRNMREFALSNPTCALNPCNNVGSCMYVILPAKGKKIRYNMIGDYSLVTIDENGDHEVSEENCRLSKLMAIPIVKEFFESHGYCTTWKDDDRVMCPTFFNNIYKGALGEMAGKAILESWGYPVREITDGDKFEKFDYVSANGTYVDFKHWAGPFMDEKEGVEKSIGKLREIGGKKAVVINIFEPEDSDCKSSPETYGEDVTLVTIPYLIDRNNKFNLDAMDKLDEVMRG